MNDVLTMDADRELAAQLCAFIDSEVSLDPDTPVKPDTDLLTTGLVDSLGAMELVHFLEEHRNIDIDPVDVTIENFGTVNSMVALATRLTSTA
ncbi:MAG: acyl carrier protein [Acidimicrobiales bacterium]|nr:acyl carrier protein [Acidimicrobiales bacterium]